MITLALLHGFGHKTKRVSRGVPGGHDGFLERSRVARRKDSRAAKAEMDYGLSGGELLAVPTDSTNRRCPDISANRETLVQSLRSPFMS
jgi:hypothetical protein